MSFCAHCSIFLVSVGEGEVKLQLRSKYCVHERKELPVPAAWMNPTTLRHPSQFSTTSIIPQPVTSPSTLLLHTKKLQNEQENCCS
jgi:hypothetical protein